MARGAGRKNGVGRVPDGCRTGARRCEQDYKLMVLDSVGCWMVLDSVGCWMVLHGCQTWCQMLIGAGWCRMVPDANWFCMVPDTVLDGARRKKGAGQRKREQKNNIFAYSVLNNGPILINFFLFESSWSPPSNGGMQYYVVSTARARAGAQTRTGAQTWAEKWAGH